MCRVAGRLLRMIKHIVMFKLKESAEGSDKAANIKALKAKLEALTAQIERDQVLRGGHQLHGGERGL